MVDGILNAARAQIREDGVAALNLHEVARRVGVSTPALYRYFASKTAVYDALFRLGTRLYCDELKALRPKEAASAQAGIRAAIEHQLDFALRNPELFQLVLQRPVPGFVPSEQALVEAAELEQIGRSILAHWIERGLIVPHGGVARAFNLLASVMSGLTSAHLANEPHLPVGQGRFASLALDAARLFEASWAPTQDKRRRSSRQTAAG